MKVVLVLPPHESHQIVPPLGLGYLASSLKRHGVDAVLVNGLLAGLTPAALAARIAATAPDAVGVTCLTGYYYPAVDLCRRLKAHGLRVLIGGVHPTFLPYQTLVDSRADFVVCGEGEVALTRLAQSGFVGDGIPGVHSLADLHGPDDPAGRAEIVHDLDDLPIPDWEQMDPNTYPMAPFGSVARRYPVGLIAATRGCPNRCSYCASPEFYQRRIRFRSPEHIVDEIAYLVARFGVREIHFTDNNLIIKGSHIDRVCELILQRGIQVTWACPNGVRPDAVRSAERLELMKRSGCYCLALGVENVNPDIRRTVKKDESMADVRRAIRLIRGAGLDCQGFFIFGFPGETPATINATIRFAVTSGLTRADFNILDVLPGSEFWTTLSGQFTPDWHKTAARDPEWIPPGLTREALIQAQRRAFWRFYLRPRIAWRMLRYARPGQFRHLLHRFRVCHII